jgi:hypothetical protein
VGRDDFVENASRRGNRSVSDLDARQAVHRQVDERVEKIEYDSSDGHPTTSPRSG